MVFQMKSVSKPSYNAAKIRSNPSPLPKRPSFNPCVAGNPGFQIRLEASNDRILVAAHSAPGEEGDSVELCSPPSSRSFFLKRKKNKLKINQIEEQANARGKLENVFVLEKFSGRALP